MRPSEPVGKVHRRPVADDVRRRIPPAFRVGSIRLPTSAPPFFWSHGPRLRCFDARVPRKSAATAVRRKRRGQPESEPQSPKRIWQRNGGKGMKTKNFPVPIPLPQFLCQKTPLPHSRAPSGNAPFAANVLPIRLPGTMAPCCTVSVFGLSSRRRLCFTRALQAAEP